MLFVLRVIVVVMRRFLRFPGGCYVEGVVMANGFFWKPSVGPIEERPGHWNGPWEYWSTDGTFCFCQDRGSIPGGLVCVHV